LLAWTLGRSGFSCWCTLFSSGTQVTTQVHARFYHVRGYLLKLASLTFITQWLWEMLQMPAYADLANQSWERTASTCALAAFGDLAIVAFVYALLALKNRDWRWGLMPGRTDYVIVALICGGMAVAIESLATTRGQWAYTDAMPRLPKTEVGLLPFLQLSFLVPLTLAISHCWYKNSVSAKSNCQL
jgi:hypothetical protein